MVWYGVGMATRTMAWPGIWRLGIGLALAMVHGSSLVVGYGNSMATNGIGFGVDGSGPSSGRHPTAGPSKNTVNVW